MSKTEQTTKEQSKNNIAAFQQTNDKFFADVENYVLTLEQLNK